jgi:hypothetical protein
LAEGQKSSIRETLAALRRNSFSLAAEAPGCEATSQPSFQPRSGDIDTHAPSRHQKVNHHGKHLHQPVEVREYVRKQEEHHRRLSFKEEYFAILRRHGMEFDERYVFDEEIHG